MDYIATITSKRQFTIPVAIFKRAKFKVNQKVLVKEDAGIVRIESMRNLVEELAGSVHVSPKYKGLTANQMVEKARSEYYKDNK